MLTKLIEIVQKKYEIDQTQKWYKGSQTYFNGLKDETEEVQVEMKENNQVYLEDELGDVLYTYLNLLVGLKEEGKISSIQSIISRSEKKFGKRINAIEHISDEKRLQTWKDVKKIQKKENTQEHIKLYGNN